IDDMSDAWDPSAYHDTFHDDIMALVERKVREGRTEEVGEVEEPRETRPSADILDRSDLLKRSLGRDRRKRAGKAAPARASDGEDGAGEQEARVAPRRAKKAPARRTASSPTARKRRAA